MRFSILASLLPAAALGAAPSETATLFSENFNAIGNSNNGVGNRGFSVTRNEVHSFGKPEDAYACPAPNGANHCVDMNGSGSGVNHGDGQLTSGPLSILGGQTYTVAFSLAGNREGKSRLPYTLDISFDGVSRSFPVLLATPFKTMSFDVAAAASGTSRLVFTSTSQDQPGHREPIIDDVRITTPDAAGGAVPEPATWLMMNLGFGRIGSKMRTCGRARSAIA